MYKKTPPVSQPVLACRTINANIFCMEILTRHARLMLIVKISPGGGN